MSSPKRMYLFCLRNATTKWAKYKLARKLWPGLFPVLKYSDLPIFCYDVGKEGQVQPSAKIHVPILFG